MYRICMAPEGNKQWVVGCRVARLMPGKIIRSTPRFGGSPYDHEFEEIEELPMDSVMDVPSVFGRDVCCIL